MQAVLVWRKETDSLTLSSCGWLWYYNVYPRVLHSLQSSAFVVFFWCLSVSKTCQLWKSEEGQSPSVQIQNWPFIIILRFDRYSKIVPMKQRCKLAVNNLFRRFFFFFYSFNQNEMKINQTNQQQLFSYLEFGLKKNSCHYY